MHKVAVLQSNYIPWKGYFDIIGLADTFIFYDDVQYTKNDWRNRNLIKTANGLQWLTVPCGRSTSRRICDVRLVSSHWQIKHWKSITQAYSNAPYFWVYAPRIEPLYTNTEWTHLSELNHTLIQEISSLLGIDTVFRYSTDYTLNGDGADRLLCLLKEVGATHYISGPSALSYIDTERFISQGIDIAWMDYSDYPRYPQLHGLFEHRVSIIDLLFNVGPDALSYMKTGNRS